MIRPLRRVHRALFALLALALPALLVAGLALRPEVVALERLPRALQSAASASDARWGGAEREVADALTYWSPTAARPGQALPAQAIWHGSRPGSPDALAAARPQTGYLLLYSLATREVVACVALEGPLPR